MKTKIKLGKFVVVVALLFLVAGCASILSSSSYPISVNSKPAGAQITVEDKKGKKAYSGITPATFQLKAGSGYFAKASYTIIFEKEGYERREIPVSFSLDGWFIGNLLFGGLIGMLIVDPITGAMWKLDNANINEVLFENTASSETPELKVYTYQDIPEEMKNKLVRIK